MRPPQAWLYPVEGGPDGLCQVERRVTGIVRGDDALGRSGLPLARGRGRENGKREGAMQGPSAAVTSVAPSDRMTATRLLHYPGHQSSPTRMDRSHEPPRRCPGLRVRNQPSSPPARRPRTP